MIAVLIESSIQSMEIMKKGLKEAGCTTIQAFSSIESAIPVLQNEEFHCCVIPGSDDALVTVASFLRAKNKPVVFIVTLENILPELKQKAYRFGADAVLPVPREMGAGFSRMAKFLLSEHEKPGFKGSQKKSMMDILQTESMSIPAVLFKFVSGSKEGLIWIENNKVLHAQTLMNKGFKACAEVGRWQQGVFSILPYSPPLEISIGNFTDSFLLEIAQFLDEHSEIETIDSLPSYIRSAIFGAEEKRAIGMPLQPVLAQVAQEVPKIGHSAGEALGFGILHGAVLFAEQTTVAICGTEEKQALVFTERNGNEIQSVRQFFELI